MGSSNGISSKEPWARFLLLCFFTIAGQGVTMPKAKHILIAVELHEQHAVPVLQWATLIARQTGGRLTLLHVNETTASMHPREAFSSSSGIDLETVERGRHSYETTTRAEIHSLIAQHCGGVPADILLLEGRAPAVILGAIESTNCDLVVMGTHGRPWYERALIGSTAEAVLRASLTPVLIVHNTAAMPPPFQFSRLLFPTDFSPASGPGEEWTRFWVAHGVHEVLLVHTVENPLLDLYNPDTVDVDVRRLMEESRQHPPRSAQPFWDHAHHFAQAKLSELRHQLLSTAQGPGQVEVLVGEGPAAEHIRHVAAQKTPDLIVMATHGHTGVQRFLLGSVISKVIRAVSCPVFVVPSHL
jgi:nucleotide-binding universal stress UspA family protein